MKKVPETTPAQKLPQAARQAHPVPAAVLRWFLYCFIFILPFKFGTFASGAEQPDFPLNALEWLIFTCWPIMLPPIIAGIALILTWIVHPLPKLTRSVALPALAFLSMLATLCGFVHTTEWNTAWNLFFHFSGAFCLSLTVYWVQASDKKLLPGLLNTIAIGGILCCLIGWQQHFGGLEAKLQMMQENAVTTAQPLSAQMEAKLMQTRSYGTFVDPNIYAAHLLLVCPFMLLALRNWSRRFEPQKLSLLLFLSLGTILYIGAVLWSGSRGAMFGLAGGICVLVWLVPMKIRWRVVMLTGGAVLGLACVLAMTYASNRNLLSASVRFQYYTTSWKIFQDSPVFGAGCGEFFPWHMRLKPDISEEARDPHSMFFAFLGQCGMIGGLVALCRILFPFALVLGLWKKFRTEDPFLFAATCCGCCSWLIHAQLQFNDTIPGTSYIAAFATLWAFSQKEDGKPLPSAGTWIFRGLVLVATVLAILPAQTIPAEIRLQKVMSEKQNSPERILKELAQLEEALPHHPAPCRIRGDFAEQYNLKAESLASNQKLAKRTPHRASAWCRLAKSQMLAGKFPEATQSLNQAELWYPYNPKMLLLRAILLLPRQKEITRERSLSALANGDCHLSKDASGYAVSVRLSSKSDFYFASLLAQDLNSVGFHLPDGTPVQFQLEIPQSGEIKS